MFDGSNRNPGIIGKISYTVTETFVTVAEKLRDRSDKVKDIGHVASE